MSNAIQIPAALQIKLLFLFAGLDPSDFADEEEIMALKEFHLAFDTSQKNH
jgi:hypothetical protein